MAIRIIRMDNLAFLIKKILRESLNENDSAHSETMGRTGFWGAQGAGCILLAKDSGRLLLMKRSAYVNEPHTWGNIGGAIDEMEDPKEAAKREVQEESGYSGSIEMIPLFVFRKSNFTYYNFLGLIETEFQPTINWESEGFEWCELGNWPSPLHFGVQSLFQDAESIQTIKETIEQQKSQPV